MGQPRFYCTILTADAGNKEDSEDGDDKPGAGAVVVTEYVVKAIHNITSKSLRGVFRSHIIL